MGDGFGFAIRIIFYSVYAIIRTQGQVIINFRRQGSIGVAANWTPTEDDRDHAQERLCNPPPDRESLATSGDNFHLRGLGSALVERRIEEHVKG